jgi:hypothetical protein
MAVAEEFGVPLAVHARTDVYLFGAVPEERRMEETVASAHSKISPMTAAVLSLSRLAGHLRPRPRSCCC